MKTFIEEFVEKVINETGSFLLYNEGQYVSFFQDSIGKARYIFTRRDYGRGDSYIGLAKLDLSPKIVAIVANGLVYIIDSYFFDIDPDWDDAPRMSNMVYFKDICRNANEQIANEIFPQLFEQIPVDILKDEEKLEETCGLYARRVLLGDMDMPPYDKCDIRLSENQIAEILCGFSTVLEKSTDLFRENESKYRNRKALLCKIKKLMQSPDIVVDWEKQLSESLLAVDAKTVTVYFTVNGRTDYGKMEPQKILKRLVERNHFYDYDFCVTMRGASVIKNVGATTNRFNEDNCPVLTCEHITKIVYGRKVLYER